MEINNSIIQKNLTFKKKYFEKLPYVNLNDILITTQGKYSISDKIGSKKLIYLITKYFKTSDIIITDGTGNIGSDTIALGLKFKKINSIELDPINFKALSNNVKVYKLKNVKLFNGDTNEILSNLEQDVIYIDAPWTGPNYKEHKTLKLFLGPNEISDVFNKFKSRAKLFVFKIPINYDFTHFIQNTMIDKYYIHSHRIEKIKFFFLFIPTI